MNSTVTKASSAALRLLHELLETSQAGRVFTSEEAVTAGKAVGLSRGHVYKLLSELTRHGALHRLRGHLYAMQAPFGGAAPIRPLAIAVRAGDPAAVSGDTALVHWGMQDQAPLHEEVISTPARMQWTQGLQADGTDRLWTVEGSTIRFRHVRHREMFGITTVRLDSETVVPMFDRERTLLELITGKTAGAAELATELLDTRREDIDFSRLKEYMDRLGIGAIPGRDIASAASLA